MYRYNWKMHIKFITTTKLIYCGLVLTTVLFLNDSVNYNNKLFVYDNSDKLLMDGDLIFRKGLGFFSDIFRSVGAEKSDYSHIGIIKKENGIIFVIHTEANELTGIGEAQKIPLEEFISDRNASSGAVYRVETANSYQKESAVKSALRYIELKTPFDSDFDLETADRLYCTELVWRAYKSCGIDLAPRKDFLHIPFPNKYRNKQFISISNLIHGGSIRFLKKIK